MKCVFFIVALTFTVLGTTHSEQTDVVELGSSVTGKTGDSTSNVPSTFTTLPDSTTHSPAPPVTTTQPPVTTTQAPTSTTEAPQAGWWVVNKTGDACILAKFGAHMSIEYFLRDNTSAPKVGVIDLPPNATVNEEGSSCGNDSQLLVLDFFHNSHLTLTFRKNGDKVILNELNIDFKDFSSFFPDSKTTGRVLHVTNITELSVTDGHSYFCSKSDISFDGGKSSISFTDIQIEAFRTSSDEKFSLAEDCDSDVSNIVPIAVGCALAGLVVIVLIAYLVGRRHKRQRGYESV